MAFIAIIYIPTYVLNFKYTRTIIWMLSFLILILMELNLFDLFKIYLFFLELLLTLFGFSKFKLPPCCSAIVETIVRPNPEPFM